MLGGLVKMGRHGCVVVSSLRGLDGLDLHEVGGCLGRGRAVHAHRRAGHHVPVLLRHDFHAVGEPLLVVRAQVVHGEVRPRGRRGQNRGHFSRLQNKISINKQVKFPATD